MRDSVHLLYHRFPISSFRTLGTYVCCLVGAEYIRCLWKQIESRRFFSPFGIQRNDHFVNWIWNFLRTHLVQLCYISNFTERTSPIFLKNENIKTMKTNLITLFFRINKIFDLYFVCEASRIKVCPYVLLVYTRKLALKMYLYKTRQIFFWTFYEIVL